MMFYRLVKAISTLYVHLKFKVDITGLEHLPQTGPVIIAANHTSNDDPIILFQMLNREIHFLAKEELFCCGIAKWALNRLCAIPVNRQSGMLIRVVRRSLKIIGEGEALGIFPEGKRARNGEMVEPKKGVAFFSCKTDAPILPIALVGVRNGFRQPIKVIVGPLIHVQDLPSTDYMSIARNVMERIRKMKNQQEWAEGVLENETCNSVDH